MDQHVNLLERTDDIRELIASVRHIAVLGIKTEQQSSQPAFYVPEYMHRAGFDVIPVPVYYPDVTEILGRPVYRRLADIPGTVDLVNVFRRPEDIEPHVEDMWRRDPPRSGSSPASGTRRPPRRWRAPASGWCRTVA